MKRAGVIGWPVAHSLSPVLHGYWLKQYGIEGSYEKIPAAPDDFGATIARLRGEGFVGVNVTVPHKEAAFALADSNDAVAQSAHATNLLVFRADGIAGRNTDAYGLMASLKTEIGPLDGRDVILLGAGGAARGALLSLDQLGAARVHLLARDEARAKALAAALAPHVGAKILSGSLAAWKSVAPGVVLAVNATSAGMGGNAPLDLDLSLLPKGAAVCDIVYHPLETPLLRDARAHDLKAIDGLGMLMHQAVPSFEAFSARGPTSPPACAPRWWKPLASARPFVIGLTGAMGMGKSTTARLFAEEGVPVFDADQAVHDIYTNPVALAGDIQSLFPGSIVEGSISRARIAAQMTPQKLEQLEALIHPLVLRMREQFVEAHAAAPILVLDVPLLLETGVTVDAVVVASAASHVQRERVLARPGMTEGRFTALSARQLSDAQKRSQAHYVVMTDKGLDHAREQVKMILADIRDKLRA